MIGRTITHYHIVEKLGEGGMGVAYKAKDTKLDRFVALKFLSPHLAGSGEDHARFLREARSAAALSHPNICTVHEVDEVDGRIFIVMEYVPGSSLKELSAAGPQSRDKVVDLISQVGAGLQEAHIHGIVHRDIKPANIMVTPQGRAKILDFGLAKSQDSTQVTTAGTPVGSAAYMSPEQARGDAVDHRTDIWSLGVMLYELLTGRRPFRGEHPQAVVYSILNEEPEPVSVAGVDDPGVLAGIIEKTLAKSPDDRYPSVADMLDDLTDTSTSPRGRPRDDRIRRWLPAIVALLVVVIAALFARTVLRTTESAGPAPMSRQVTFSGAVRYAALSPDGKFVAYTNSLGDGFVEISIKDLDSGSAIPICRARGCFDMHWSPDGSRLLFSGALSTEDRGCYIMPRLGGDARKVLDTPWANTTWSPDGARFAYVLVNGNQVFIQELTAGAVDSVPLPRDVGEVMTIQWHPREDVVMVHADDSRRQVLWAVRLDNGESHAIYEKAYDPTQIIKTPYWSNRNDAVYVLQSSMRGQMVLDLIRVPIDPERLTATGEPDVVMSGLQLRIGPSLGGEYSLSRDERMLLYTRETVHSNIWVAALEGEGDNLRVDPVRLTSGTTLKSRPRISPDGRRIVFAVSEGNARNVFVQDLPADPSRNADPPPPRQLTYQTALNDFPAWSPDGRRIAYLSTEGGAGHIWSLEMGGGTPRMLGSVEVSPWADVLEWASGPGLIFRGAGLDALTLLDPESGEQRVLEAGPGSYFFEPSWSPDGTHIALFKNIQRPDRQEMGLWLYAADGGPEHKLAEGLIYPVAWSPDGQWIYVWWSPDIEQIHISCIARVPAAGGPPEYICEIPRGSEKERYSGLDMTSDGRTIVWVQDEVQADVWLVENFGP